MYIHGAQGLKLLHGHVGDRVQHRGLSRGGPADPRGGALFSKMFMK